MLVATFNEKSGWAGKHITYSNGTFYLEGYGVISSKAVEQYGTQDLLIWSSETMRGERIYLTKKAHNQKVFVRPLGIAALLLLVLGFAGCAGGSVGLSAFGFLGFLVIGAVLAILERVM